MKRRRIDELMDSPSVEPSAHEHALRALNRVNRWLGVHHQLGRDLWGLVEPGSTYSVLDLGAGGGGFLAFLATKKTSHSGTTGQPIAAAMRIGLDRSAFAMQCARS